jgi:hypothetical protein
LSQSSPEGHGGQINTPSSPDLKLVSNKGENDFSEDIAPPLGSVPSDAVGSIEHTNLFEAPGTDLAQSEMQPSDSEAIIDGDYLVQGKNHPKPIELPAEPRKGLVPKGGKKVPISDGEINSKDLSIVIGPMYVMKYIVMEEFQKELPKAPLDPRIEYAYAPKETGNEEEMDNQKVLRMNQALLNVEMIRISTGPSRFLKEDKRKGRKVKLKHRKHQLKFRRKIKLSTRNSKRGMKENGKFHSLVCKMLPRRFRPLSFKLNKISSKKVSMKSLASLDKLETPNFKHLPLFRTKKQVPFRVINTTKQLGAFPVKNDRTILLQWGRARPSIRNIRVDGVNSRDSIFWQKITKLSPYFQGTVQQYLLLCMLIFITMLSITIAEGILE